MNQEYYITLISKQLSGTLSEKESVQLKEWTSENSANASLRKQVEKSWENANHYKSNLEVNEDAAWESIMGKLNQDVVNPAPTKTKVIPLWKRPLSIAATLLLLIAGSWFFINNSAEEIMNYSTANNETKNFVLPDGSKVTLNENSELTYDANAGNRLLNLSGEGFFEVTHNKEKPFIVNAHGTTTTVLGTVFNVDANIKDQVEVTLMEGKVSFEAPDLKKIILAPKQKVNYTKGQNDLALTTVKNENNVAWKTKKLNFKDTKITKVVETINEYFDKDLLLELKDSTCLFTGSFPNPNYNEVLEVLKFTYDLEIENNTSRLIINKCK